MAGMGEPARGVRALGAMEMGQVQSALIKKGRIGKAKNVSKKSIGTREKKKSLRPCPLGGATFHFSQVRPGDSSDSYSIHSMYVRNHICWYRMACNSISVLGTGSIVCRSCKYVVRTATRAGKRQLKSVAI